MPNASTQSKTRRIRFSQLRSALAAERARELRDLHGECQFSQFWQEVSRSWASNARRLMGAA